MKTTKAILGILTNRASQTFAMTGPVSGRKPLLALLMRLLWAAALLLPALGAQAGVALTTLHSFADGHDGVCPVGGLVQGSDGNFYGTTSGGGTGGGYGTVFKISTNGALTTLYSFTSPWQIPPWGGSPEGARPVGGLVQGSDGNFYGTTAGDSTSQSWDEIGAVFKISPNGALTTLYSFTSGNDGGYPEAGLVQGSDGNFYGTTSVGGTYSISNLFGPPSGGYGTVFKITPNGALTSLYSFTGGNDGALPEAALVQGSDGNFYGTTAGGGNTNLNYGSGYGTVFKIGTNGALTSLYSFTGGNDGALPKAGLVQGSDGNLYGTTYGGGAHGYGTVFEISTNGALTSLYSFTGGDDGANPYAALVQASDGNFYGTTESGGANNAGTVFTISPNGALTSLYSFTGGNDGGQVTARLVQASDGNFYGTTESGGTNNSGTVFKISPNGALTSLYSFNSPIYGFSPGGGLVQGSGGNFYGTTSEGGSTFQLHRTGDYGFGTVFKISPNGALTGLYSFPGPTGSPVGNTPSVYPSGLVQGSDGNFYGTTGCAGSPLGPLYVGCGTLFKISANGRLTTLYSFTGGKDGWYPGGGLVQGSDGKFYGTTGAGGWGTNYEGYGTVFKISPNGALTTLYSFSGTNDGANPQAALVQGSDGYFYGTTSGGGEYTNQYGQGIGTVFKISPNGALTSLHSFTGGNDGAYPNGLVQGSDGYFYGTTCCGGTQPGWSGYGTVFKISPNGALTSLYSFTGGNDGGGPNRLVQGNDGNFYGTTSGGGTNNSGTVFKMSTNGALTSLYSFTGGNDGANPSAALVQGRDGNFYGTTYSGGAGNAGTVFRLTVVWAAPVFQPVGLTNSTLSLTWSTEAGGRYQLQYTSDLSSSNWTNLGSAVTATGPTLSATDSVTNGPPRFYRVVLLP